MVTQSVAVVHLVWLPFGIDLFKSFIQSYKKNNAGYPHDLVMLFNGVKDNKDTAPYHDYLIQEGIGYTDFCLTGDLDIVAYHKVAQALNQTYVLFLNSYAVLLTPDWLKYFVTAISENKTGIVGATGSWQSYFSSVLYLYSFRWEKGKSIRENLSKYKLILKAFFYWRLFFKPFPNPHIRTSSFIINRQLFLEIDTSYIKSKFGAYCFESGRKGLSNALLKKGLQLMVIDRHGKTYHPQDWPAGLTFHIKEQEGLLVSDNRTREYQESGSQGKKTFTYLAWGHNNEV